MLIRCLWAICFLALAAAASRSSAQPHAGVAPFVADDVIAVATLDLQRIDLPAILGELQQKKLLPAELAAGALLPAAAVQTQIASLQQLGAQRAYAIMRFDDALAGGPLWVVETGDAKQAAAVAEWLKLVTERPDMFGDVDDMLPRAVKVQDRFVLGGPSAERIDYLADKVAASPRADAAEALAGVAEADAAVVVFGNADTRRVLREMFPALPAPFADIDGKLVADGVKWIAATVKLPPEIRVGLTVQAADEPAAATLNQAATNGLQMLKALAVLVGMNPTPDMPFTADQLVKGVDALAPRVEGARLEILLGDDADELALLQEFAGRPIQQARAGAQRAQRMNNFKQIALGMLNHENAKRAYPAAASYSSDGKPLLSWRVHILPFIEEYELYQQFHLDEPWDSEHNLKLVEQMPQTYTDPDAAISRAIGAGKTTFLVPTGEKLMFGKAEGTKIRDVTDGTSNTILAVEVAPEKAVVWTKPDDWQVDLSDPLAGVKREDREGFIAAFSDGSVHFLSNQLDPETLRGLLTPAGGEIVDDSAF